MKLFISEKEIKNISKLFKEIFYDVRPQKASNGPSFRDFIKKLILYFLISNNYLNCDNYNFYYFVKRTS